MRWLLLILALGMSQASAGTMDEIKCRNGRVPSNLVDAVTDVDDRVVACFNYQKSLAEERDQKLRGIIRELIVTVRELDIKVRKLEQERK